MSKKNQVKAQEAVVEQALDDLLEEELVEAAVEPVVLVAEKKAVEPLAVIEGQLSIYENRVINVPEGARVAVVHNLGFGDLYVDNTGIQFTANYRIDHGSKKEYKGAKVLFLGSASRPEFRIEFYK